MLSSHKYPPTSTTDTIEMPLKPDFDKPMHKRGQQGQRVNLRIGQHLRPNHRRIDYPGKNKAGAAFFPFSNARHAVHDERMSTLARILRHTFRFPMQSGLSLLMAVACTVAGPRAAGDHHASSSM